jgi:hypothetical protein
MTFSAGNVLLRVELSCDVQFWSDMQVDGCTTEGSLLCQGSDASDCSAGLTLTVTPGEKRSSFFESISFLISEPMTCVTKTGSGQTYGKTLLIEVRFTQGLSWTMTPVRS